MDLTNMPRNTAGGIIVNPKGEIVVVEQNGNSWAFPKGGIEAGESEFEAALREISEETGLGANDLEYIGELGSYVRYSIGIDGKGEDTSRPPSTRTFYLFKAKKEDLLPQDGEITQIRWMSVDGALIRLTHSKDREFLEGIRAKIEACRSR